MDSDRAPQERPALAVLPLTLIAAAKLAIHLYALPHYGWFRDEFYYQMCAAHPALGYVDHPPLSIWILGVVRALAGESLWAMRLVPVLAGLAAVFVTGQLARELGGGARAQALAGLAVLVAPVYLALHHFYSMNAFDVVLWPLAFLALARAMRHDRGEAARARAAWAALGVVLGLGLLNKISVLWLAGGLGLGVLLTRLRLLRTLGPWLALGVAALLFAPHIAWQVANDWPTVEFMRNATGGKMAPVSAPEFIQDQILSMNPATLPLWLGGLVWCLFARRGEWRWIAVAYLAITALLIAGGRSRTSYLSPAYPALFAAGAAALGGWLDRRPAALRHGLTALVAGSFLAVGAVLAPLALPVLPVDSYIAYAKRLGFAPSTEEIKEVGLLSQHYADMHGWEELTAAVVAARDSLPPGERERACIYGQNYGEAGAVTILGRARGLPPAIAGHNNYWLWGPGSCDGSVMIIIGGDREDHAESFESVEPAGVATSRYAMPYEQNLTVWVCRGLKQPPREIWPRVKHYD